MVTVVIHIDAETKWLPYCRQHFQSDFLIWELFLVDQVTLKYDPMGSINNKLELVQIMAWCWTGNKPLSEPVLR